MSNDQYGFELGRFYTHKEAVDIYENDGELGDLIKGMASVIGIAAIAAKVFVEDHIPGLRRNARIPAQALPQLTEGTLLGE